MKHPVMLFAAVLLLTACTKPQDTLIPSDVSTWDKDLAPAIQKLPEEERKLIAAYLVRAKLGEALGGTGGVPIGTTVGEGIAKQRTWQAEQERKAAEEKAAQAKQEAEARALREKLEADQASAIEALNRAAVVTLVGKSELGKDFRAGRYSDYQQFRIGVKNSSEKPITGVSGELKFVDLFDKEVGAVVFRISETIKPGGDYVWTGGRDYNEFIDTHRAVWNLEAGKYTTRYIPDTVLFADGTKLVMPK